MSSRTTSSSDKPSVDDSSKPTDDVSDSSQPCDNSSNGGSSKPSAGQSQDTPDSNESSKRKPLNVLLDAKVQSLRKVPLKVRGDYQASWITGCAFLPNGYAVLCDHSNNRVKLLDESLRIKGSVYMGYPGDVAVVDEYRVIVSMAQEQRLQYIRLPSMQLEGSISVGKFCYGIDVAKDLIFVACHSNFSEVPDGEVRVYDMTGTLIKRICGEGPCALVKPHNLAVSRCGTKLFVSDLGTRIIYCIGANGGMIYQNKDDFRGPRNVYLDAENNAYICDYDTNTVKIIAANGRGLKNPLIQGNGIEHPNSIAFRPEDGTMIIGCAGMEKLFVFTLA